MGGISYNVWLPGHRPPNQTLLFYILAPTCFGSSLPSSGSVLYLPELLEIQIEWVVYHIMCGYLATGHLTKLFCSIYWLLHVSAVACHHQGASYIFLSYLKYKSNGWYII